MANATIKITNLPNIGNGLSTTSIFPVVANVNQTDKVTLGNVGNLILTEAGNTLEPAFVSQLAYSVTNAAQPNITSVGTLTSLEVSGNIEGNLNLANIANLKIDGGTNGYVIQTDGAGNLTWTAQTGNGGGSNGTPGGSNTQIQFNDAGEFGGNSGFTFNKVTGSFVAPSVTASNLQVSTNSLLGDNSTPGEYFVYRDTNQVSIGQVAAQTIDINSNGISLAGTSGVSMQGVANANITIGGGTTGNVVFPDGITFNDGSYQNTAYTGTSEPSDRLVNGNLEVVLDSSGTLNTPLLLPTTFTAVLNSAHSTSPLTLTGTAWQFVVAFQVNPNGTVQTTMDNPFPTLTNPGYTTGNEFEFTQADHGIPGYVFTITLNDVVQAGPAGWTASPSVSQPPVYPSTIASDGAIKLTSDANSIVFGTDGVTTFPDGTTTTGSITETMLGDDFVITTQTTGPSIPAICLTGDSGTFITDITDNDDITLVEVGWTVIVGETLYTVTDIDPSPPINQFICSVPGAVFETDTEYTFTDPNPATSTWTLGANGTLTIPGGGTISQQANDLFVAVSGTDIIGLRTEGGDVILDAEGNLNIPGQLISTTSVSRLSLNEQGGGGAYLTSTDDDSTALFLRTTDVQMYAGINQTITAGTILPGLETDYIDSNIILGELFAQNELEPGYPWGITLPTSYLTLSELQLLAPDTFPNQVAVTTQAQSTNNFYELWQQTITEANVTITSNENSWVFDGEGNLTLPGSIVPDTDITYDLGNSTNRWRDLYLSGNTIWLGVFTKLSGTSSGELYVPGGISGGGGIVGVDQAGPAGLNPTVSTDKKTITFSPPWNPLWTNDPILTGPNHSPYFSSEQIGTDATFTYNKTGTSINSLTLATGGSGYDTSLIDTDIWYFTPAPNEAMTVTGVMPPTGFSYLVLDPSVGNAQHTATITIDGVVWTIVYTLTPGSGTNEFVVNPATTTVRCNGSAVTNPTQLAQLYNYNTFYVHQGNLTALSLIPPAGVGDFSIEFILTLNKAWYNTDSMVTIGPLFGANSTTTQGNTTIVGSSTVTGNQIVSEDLSVSGNVVISGNLTVSPDSIHMGDITFSAPTGDLVIAADTANWTFGQDGNITLPTNSSSINYANGQPYGGGSGGPVSQLTNGDNSFVLDADGNVVFEGLAPGDGVDRGLVWDYGANANGVNSMVRQDMNGITVRAWTEQGGGANGYSAPVRIVTNQDDTEKAWYFDGAGNLTLPGNLNIPTGNIVSNIVAPAFTSGITSIDVTGNANVTITISNEVFEGNVSGQVTISNVNAPAQANGDWWYQASDFDKFQLYTDSSLTTPVDGSSWPGYAGPGGDAVGVGTYSNLTVQGGNISVRSNDKIWQFDTTGNLTVPSNSSINAINSGGNLGAYLNLTPDIGLAKLAGREIESNVNYTSVDWTSASYTGTQIDFVDSPQLVNFFTNDRFNAGVNQTFSINGGNRLPYTGYTIGVSNAVTVYTTVTASPDPTTVTSIDFYYQLESYIDVDYDDGTLNINATGLTINIDNDQTQNPDINIRSGDDILLQAKNKSLGSESEGGDINIYAGDGASDDGTGNFSNSGGDIQIEAGNGGDGNTSSGSSGGFATLRGGQGGIAGVGASAGSGGYVAISGGNGGDGNGDSQLGAGGGYVSIAAGDSTQEGVNGADVSIDSGAGGPNALAGNIQIFTPVSDNGPGGTWTFDGEGNLTLPNGIPYIKTSDETSTINIKVSGSANNRSQFSIGSDGGTDQYTYISSQNDTNGFASFGLNAYSGVPTTAVIGINNGTALDWTFTSAALDDTEAYLYMPAGTTVTTPNAPVGQTGKNIFIEAGSVDQENYNTNTGGELMLKGGRGGFEDGGGGGPGGNVNINAGESADPAGHAGNVNITAGALTNWTFDYTGNLTLPANTFSVNYANGTPVTFGAAALGNVTFDNVTVQGVNGLNLSAGPDFTANLAYLQVRAGDVASHIHFDTGNNEAYDLIVGNDQKFVQVSSTGNILMSSYDGAFSYEMNLDNTGNLTIPGNLIAATASPAPRISGFDSVSALAFTNGTSNVTINANSNLWNFDSTGNLIIPGTSGGMIKTVANGAIGITAINNGSDNPAQMMSWTVGETNPDTIISTYSSNALIQSNVNGTLNTWKFDDAGNLTLPANTFAINYANGTQVSLGGSSISNGNSNVTIATSAGNVVTNVTGQTILTVYTGGIKVGGSGIIQSPGGAQAIVLNNNGANLPIANITNTLNVTGAAGANITSNLVVGGTVTATGKIGYSVGGAVTQTALGQSVTINQLTGKITMASKSWNTGDVEVFLVNCNKVTTDDFILVQPTGSTQSIYFDVVAYSPVANQFYVYVRSNEIVTEAVTVQFFIMKAPIA